MDGDDINTVAGLLKMYLRELKEPLFPSEHFDGLLRCCEVMYSAEGGWQFRIVIMIVVMVTMYNVVSYNYCVIMLIIKMWLLFPN